MTKLFDDEPMFLHSVEVRPGNANFRPGDKYIWCVKQFGDPIYAFDTRTGSWAYETIKGLTVYSFKHEKDLMLFLLTWR